MAYTDIIAQLAVSLDMDSGGFVRKTADAEKAADKMGRSFDQVGGKVRGASGSFAAFAKGFAGAFAGSQLIRAAAGAIESAASIDKMASAAGVGAEDFQRFEYAVKALGGDQTAAGDALTTLTQKIGQAANGSKAAASTFADLGVQIRDAAGNVRPTSELLPLIVDALAKIPDAASRSATGAQLFGEKWKEIAPAVEAGASAIKKAGDDAANAGKILTDQQVADAKRVKAEYDDIADRISTGFQKAVIATVGALDDSGNAIERWRQKLGGTETQSVFDALLSKVDGFEAGVNASMGHVADAIEDMASRAVSAASRMAAGISTWLVGKLSAVWASIKEKAGQAGDHFLRMYDRVVGHSYVPDMVDGIRDEMARLDAVLVAPAARATQSAADAFRDLQSKVSSLLAQLFPEAAKTNRLLDEVNLLDEAMRQGAISADTYNAAIARVTENAGMTRDGLTNPPIFDDREADRQGMVDGAIGEIDAAMERFDKDLDDKLAKPAEDKTARVIDAFGQMASGVVSSLRYMVDSFKHGDILGGLQSILDIVSQVVNVLARTGIIKGAPTNYDGPRAAGGPVSAGKTYLVGERGPEFITPRRSGYVHPNGTAMGASRVEIVPSRYFDVVVDGRAQRVAAPMAAHAAVGGALGAQQSLARRRRMSLA